MGKAQKKRNTRRHNPVRVPDSHLQHGLAVAAASTPANKREALVPVIEKVCPSLDLGDQASDDSHLLLGPLDLSLTIGNDSQLASQDIQERIWACAAVSNLIQNDSSTRRLLQGKNVVGILISRLGDDVDEVVIEAAGALRNLCIDGGYEICAEMFNKGILKPLATFIPKISMVLSQFFSNPKGSVESARFVYDFAENVITLFWCLSETSNKALNAINQLHLVPFLMAFLDSKSREKLAITTVTAAAQCLYVLTEENDIATDEVRMNTGYINCLFGIARGDPKTIDTTGQNDRKTSEITQRIIQTRVLSLRTLVCGILRNIQPLPALIPVSTIDIDQTVILPILLPLLSLDISTTVASVHKLLAHRETGAEVKDQAVLKNGAKSDHKSDTERQLECIESELRIVILTLELITDICAELPEVQFDEEEAMENSEEEEEEEWESDSQDNDDIAMREDHPMETDDASPMRPKSIDLVSSTVPACLSFIQPTPMSYPPPTQPSPHPPITSALGAVHIAALECLNNVCLSVAQLSTDNIHPNVAQHLASIWPSVWTMLSTLGPPEYIQVGGSVYHQKRKAWRIALSTLWAVARIRRGDPALVPEEGTVKLLMDICSQSAEDDDVKVTCLGILECLAMSPTFVSANKPISQFLLSFLPNPAPKTDGVPHTSNQGKTSPEVVIQAASSIIDIFSDEQSPWDATFREGQWEKLLRSSLDGVRKAVRSIDTRKEGGKALRARGDEVLLNLGAFIKYRKSLKL